VTQLELPPISFARYLDLLKRRRWQVIPMSVFGLVVGGVIAFFVPRYYVAETELVYTGMVLDTDSKTGADPLYQRVLGAKSAVTATIPKTAEELQWVGRNEDDPVRQNILDGIRARTSVEAWQVSRERSDYKIKIVYRDVDGVRAKTFANRLRETWVADLMQQFNHIAANELRLATNEVTNLSHARDEAFVEIKNFRQEHQLERGEEDFGGQAAAETGIKTDLRAHQAMVTQIQAGLIGKRLSLDTLQQSIEEGVIPARKPVSTPLSADPQLAEQAQRLQAQIVAAQAARDGWRPGTYWHGYHQAVLEAAQQQLRALAPGSAEAGVRVEMVENPDYVARLAEINQLKADISVLESQLGVYLAEVAELEDRLRVLPEIWRDYELRLAEKARIEERLAAAQARTDSFRNRWERARTIDPFSSVVFAVVPSTPTEPNVSLVALAGSLLGLAAAIGLVLLLDILRASFKTVDDVSYALKLPVLGVMSHLETEEMRVENQRHRRVVAAVIAVFLTLLIGVITVYYVAPTRLPTSVHRVLDALLAGGGEAVR
jgi:capsular polysaccharide biosynthesis protein